jgi:predicted nucleotidyltransferase
VPPFEEKTMTREKAYELLEAIKELKVCKKRLKNYSIALDDVIIDSDVEIYLRGVVEAGVNEDA